MAGRVSKPTTFVGCLAMIDEFAYRLGPRTATYLECDSMQLDETFVNQVLVMHQI